MQNLRAKFEDLVLEWNKTRPMLSSRLEDHYRVPAYQELICLGMPVVPLIMEQLEQKPDWWFWALRAITNVDPAKPEHAGMLHEISKDWQEWWKDNQGHTRDVEKEFPELYEKWNKETGFLSNITTISMKPSYQVIMGLGNKAIPLMLRQFEAGKYHHWFWALYFLSGREIIPWDEKNNGRVALMAEAWVNWGKGKGII